MAMGRPALLLFLFFPLQEIFQHLAGFHDQEHFLQALFEERRVLQGVAVHNDQVSPFALLDRAKAVGQAAQFGVGAGGADDGFHGRHDLGLYISEIWRHAHGGSEDDF